LRNSNAIPILPERLCKEITEFLPSNAILVSDTGFAGVWAGTMVYLTHPDQLSIRSAGSLGWAFAASLGAKCGAPERPVICFIGDGGFWYHLSELETASRKGIKTVTVINNNSCFKQCMRGVNRAYGDCPGCKEDMYKFRDTNFAQIAEDMGCFGIRVERPEELSNALKKALEADVAAVVDVITDPEHDAPWPPPAIRKPG
jgi:acetolactate synthase-1/2/3 large subunit